MLLQSLSWGHPSNGLFTLPDIDLDSPPPSPAKKKTTENDNTGKSQGIVATLKVNV